MDWSFALLLMMRAVVVVDLPARAMRAIGREFTL